MVDEVDVNNCVVPTKELQLSFVFKIGKREKKPKTGGAFSEA